MIENFIYPFDIVSCQYTDLNGSVKTNPNGLPQKALFMVLSVSSGNVTACKLTSHSSIYTEDFCYKLRIDSHPFLVSESNVQCNKLHTLNLFRCTKVGTVAPQCRHGVLFVLTKYFGHLRLELDKYAPRYISPNQRGFGGTGYDR